MDLKRFPHGIVASISGILLLILTIPDVRGEHTGTDESGPPQWLDGKNQWPSFRGPGGFGHAFSANPPLTWHAGDGKNIRWKAAIPKPGMSSPVVWDDRVFLTGADKEKREIYCLDADTGRMVWTHVVDGIEGSPTGDQLPDVMDTTGLAAPTAATSGSHVAAIFATGDIICLDMDGSRVWASNLGVPKNHYGHSSSLIIHENRLLVQYDQKEKSELLAFDLNNGELLWRAERDEISWSSPILIENDRRRELVVLNCRQIDAYDPATGKKLWHVPGLSGEVAASPAYSNGLLFVANEFSAAAAVDIRTDPTNPEIIWAWAEILPDASSPVADENFMIVPSSYGIITCLDTGTGNPLWEHEFETGFYSSPILVDDMVYILDLKGTMRIIKMADQFKLLASPGLGEPTKATPAFVGRRIYIRGENHLFCIGENGK
jgi:outer membrane protein assembly factor BamB